MVDVVGVTIVFAALYSVECSTKLFFRSFFHSFVFSFVCTFVLAFFCFFLHSFVRSFILSSVSTCVLAYIRFFVLLFVTDSFNAKNCPSLILLVWKKLFATDAVLAKKNLFKTFFLLVRFDNNFLNKFFCQCLLSFRNDSFGLFSLES